MSATATRAAVFTGVGQPLEIKELELDAPKAGEVKVKIAASGVCHSDLSIQNGTLPLAPPIVLGHEGAGVVVEVGDGVTSFKEGDHVVTTWVGQCGTCYTCMRGEPSLCEVTALVQATNALLDGTPRFSEGGSPVGQMSACGTFTEYTVVPSIACVKVPEDIPLDRAALLGCGVLTGCGAALNTAGVKPGDTVAVIGCGGVGLNVIQGARIAGAAHIIAVDMVASKLELARTFGATHTVDASEGDPVEAVKALTGSGPMGPRGVDIAFEVVGSTALLQQALGMARRGGRVVFVGVSRMDDMMTWSPFMDLFAFDKKISGSFYGHSNIHRDIARYVDLYREGKLLLDELVSATITLDDVNAAFAALEKGEVARSVIEYK